MFVDRVKIQLIAGKGGNAVVTSTMNSAIECCNKDFLAARSEL